MKIKQAEFGEAISLGISIVLILSLFVYLIFCMMTRGDSPYVRITAYHGNVSELPDGSYIVPVTVKNEGETTVSFVKISVAFGGKENQEIEIEYLPRRSARQVYLYVDRSYPEDSIQFSPVYYQLD